MIDPSEDAAANELDSPSPVVRRARAASEHAATRAPSRSATPVEPAQGGVESIDPSSASVERPVAAKTLPSVRHDALAQAILARARNLSPSGSVGLRFALSPPELGAISIKIEARGEQLRVELVASSSAAADTLNAGLPRLTSQLNQAGYTHAEVTLGLDTGAGQNMHAGNQGTGSRGADNRTAPGRADEPTPVTDESSAQRPTPRGRLDRMA